MLSSESKNFASKEGYINIYSNRAELLASDSEILMSNVKEVHINPTIDKLKLYEIQYTMINKNNKDTIDTDFFYSTVINENGAWKIIWTVNLWRYAHVREQEGKYLEAIEDYKMILEIDPYNNMAYRGISSCQCKLGLYELALESNKKALEFSPRKGMEIMKAYIKQLEDLIKKAPNNKSEN